MQLLLRPMEGMVCSSQRIWHSDPVLRHFPTCQGMSGLQVSGGGGGVNRAPKIWGRGFGKRAQLPGTIDQLS